MPNGCVSPPSFDLADRRGERLPARYVSITNVSIRACRWATGDTGGSVPGVCLGGSRDWELVTVVWLATYARRRVSSFILRDLS